jgi:putative endonuclease
MTVLGPKGFLAEGPMSRRYFVYILTNEHRTTLYTGVTGDLLQRVEQHRQKLVPGFTQRYNVDRLAHYEEFEDVRQAIEREKQLKAGSRQKKLDLIAASNPEWKDLFEDLLPNE